MSECMVLYQINKTYVQTFLYPNVFLEMYPFEILFSFFLLLLSFRAESNGTQSLVQHCPDLNKESGQMRAGCTVVMQPLQIDCMTAVE